MYIHKSNNVVHKYNVIYHRRNKMKPPDVKQSTYVDSSPETNDQNPKFKIGDIVKVWNYKNIFWIDCVPNWSEGVFVIKNVINDLKDEGSVGTFYIKEL